MLFPRPWLGEVRHRLETKASAVQRFPPRDMHDPSSNGVRARATMPKRSDGRGRVITGSNSKEEVLLSAASFSGRGCVNRCW